MNIQGIGSQEKPIVIQAMTAAGMVTAIVGSLDGSFGPANWGIQAWTYDLQENQNIIRFEIVTKSAAPQYFYISFNNPIEWMRSSQEERKEALIQIVDFLMRERAAKSLQTKVFVLDGAAKVAARIIVVLILLFLLSKIFYAR